MLQAYGTLEQAITAEVLDAKIRGLIVIVVAITTRCESCINVYAAATAKAGATESEVASVLVITISLNVGVAYIRVLCTLEMTDAQR